MRCEVKLFGPQADAVGASSVPILIEPGITRCSDLLQMLSEQHEALRHSIGVSRLAVDYDLAEPSTLLKGTEELALIGLVNGG
jgi:molybdopterin converting factor small subunit